jgi:5-methylcytosine-specific restriction endonuclease McrA
VAKKNGKLKFNCIVCEKEFRSNHRSSKYCSDECRRVWGREKYCNGAPKSWLIIREHVMEEQDYICECGEDAKVVHHILPLSCGGTNDRDNLEGVCKKCHRARHNKLLEEL